jgi:metal-sulfur cluster biosynthetic enzyme
MRMIEEKQVWKALEKVMDPEVPLSVVDLGLIYDVAIADKGIVHVAMTLTTKGCPMSQTLTKSVQEAVSKLPGVTSTTVDLIWDPPWNPRMISLEGQKKLGKAPGAVKVWEKY